MRFLVAREAAVHHQCREGQLKMPQQRAQCAATLRGKLVWRGIPTGVEAKFYRIIPNRIQPHEGIAGLQHFHPIQAEAQSKAFVLGGRLLGVPRQRGQRSERRDGLQECTSGLHGYLLMANRVR